MTLHSPFPREKIVASGALADRGSFIRLILKSTLMTAAFAAMALLPSIGRAQEPAKDSIPPNSSSNATQPGQTTQPAKPDPKSTKDDDQLQQTKRILGVLPNFRSVNAGEKLPAQSVKEKFLTATDDSFDYSSVFIPAVLAGYSMATNATPEFHQGAAGYARYFWHAAVDQTSENYMVEFVVPVLTHQDTRYYTLGRGGFLKRFGYAMSRAVITRSDSGREEFNVSEVVGAGASSGLSSLYYPAAQRSVTSTGTQWGLDIGIDALSFAAKEFWPDINRRLFRGRE